MQADTIQAISLMLGAAWASGINLYAAIVMLGLMGSSGQVSLPPELEVLTNPMVIGAAGLMYLVEFFADKTPGVDTAWDAIHTFIRIPAGALLAAGASSGIAVDPGLQLAAGLVGGTLSASSHFSKAGTRILINTSPEPVSNWAASITEDIAVIGGLWTALHYPWVFIALLVVFLLLLAWLLPKLWRAISSLFRRIGRWFGNRNQAPPAATPDNKSDDVLRSLYHKAGQDKTDG